MSYNDISEQEAIRAKTKLFSKVSSFLTIAFVLLLISQFTMLLDIQYDRLLKDRGLLIFNYKFLLIGSVLLDIFFLLILMSLVKGSTTAYFICIALSFLVFPHFVSVLITTINSPNFELLLGILMYLFFYIGVIFPVFKMKGLFD